MKKCILIIVIALFLAFLNTAESIQITDFVKAARSQIGKTRFYDPSYQVIGYPNGDVAIERGVCTDVIIRALRGAYNYDLQKAVHEDMKKHFTEYPQIWGLRQPDKNIDHRRVPNLQTFFKRKDWSLPLPNQPTNFKSGDIVTCIVPPNRPHIMIVSDQLNKDNIPFVIHNIGNGTQEEDLLLKYRLTGHYRIKFLEQGPLGSHNL
jgi:uncharacterized protein YijF (DUF1287 family)